MTDFDDMTDEEIAAWAAAERARSLAAFADQPRHRVSEAKRSMPMELEFRGFGLSLQPGKDVAVWRTTDAEPLRATVLGLRRLGRGVVLGVRLPDGTAWTCVRADGEPWPADTSTVDVTIPEQVARLIATPEAGGRSETWTARTTRLAHVEGLPPR